MMIRRLLKNTMRVSHSRMMSSGNFQACTTLTEDEAMIQESVRRWAQEELAPHVREMDRDSKMKDEIIHGLFENGFMGVEVEAEHGGTEASFVSALLVVEELAKVDPSVSVMCDIHNTLIINMLRFWGSDELKQEWLPRLSSECVGAFCLSESGFGRVRVEDSRGTLLRWWTLHIEW